MSYPALPNSATHNVQNDGGGSIVRASIPSTLLARGEWLDRRRGGSSAMWSRPLIADGVAPATLNTPISYGVFLCPPHGSSIGRLNVSILIDSYAAPDSLAYRAQFFELAGDGSLGAALTALTAIATPSADGWHSASVAVPDMAERPYAMELTGLQASAASQRLASVCVTTLADDAWTTEAVPVAFPKTSTTALGAADRPLDAYSLRRIGSAYNHVGVLYPQVLVSHSFAADTVASTSAVAAEADSVTARYRVPIGPQVTDLTVYARVNQNSASSTAGGGTIEMLVDGVALVPAVTDSIAGTVEQWIPLTILAADLTANTVHEIAVRVHAGYAAGGAAEEASLYEIAIVQGAFDEANFTVANGTRLEAVTPRLLASLGYRGTQPIVGSYRASDIQDGSGDRETLMRNAMFLAQHKVMCLVADRVGTVESGGTKTTAISGYASPTTLYETRHRAQRGAGSVDVWAQLRRVGQADARFRPRIEVWKGDLLPSVVPSAATGIYRDLGSEAEWLPSGALDRRWYRIGTVPVTEGSTHEIQIRAGWVNAAGVSEATLADSLVLSGVCVYEQPAAGNPAAQYFYALNSGLSVAIPDNDVGGVATTITVPAAQAFTVRRVRVHCEIAHTAPADIEVTLTSPTATTRQIRIASGATAAQWFSDAAGGFTTPDGDGTFTDDETPGQTLASFIGETSAGVWTLKAIDSLAGGTGTIAGFGLEMF